MRVASVLGASSFVPSLDAGRDSAGTEVSVSFGLFLRIMELTVEYLSPTDSNIISIMISQSSDSSSSNFTAIESTRENCSMVVGSKMRLLISS